MLQGPIVDVAIGLIFFYVLLSLVCSAVQELLAALFGLRSGTLKAGVTNLVGDYADKMYEHPLISSLSKPRRPNKAERQKAKASSEAHADSRVEETGRSKPRPPSYIRVETLAAALLEVIAREANDEEKKRASELSADGLRSAIEKIDERLPVREFLLCLVDDGKSDLAEIKTYLASWFDESMDRVSGWYKRKVQYFLLGVAAVVTVAVNADTLQMAERLWTDEALRSAVVEAALADSEDGGGNVGGGGDGRAEGPGGNRAGGEGPDNNDAGNDSSKDNSSLDDTSERNDGEPQGVRNRDAGLAGGLADARAELLETFPLGYADDAWVRRFLRKPSGENEDDETRAEGEEQAENDDDWLGDAAESLVGWALTTAAISLGAPFWFDVLGRVARLRGSGRIETSRAK